MKYKVNLRIFFECAIVAGVLSACGGGGGGGAPITPPSPPQTEPSSLGSYQLVSSTNASNFGNLTAITTCDLFSNGKQYVIASGPKNVRADGPMKQGLHVFEISDLGEIKNVTESIIPAQPNKSEWTLKIVCADVNQDAKPDVMILNQGWDYASDGEKQILYINNGSILTDASDKLPPFNQFVTDGAINKNGDIFVSVYGMLGHFGPSPDPKYLGQNTHRFQWIDNSDYRTDEYHAGSYFVNSGGIYDNTRLRQSDVNFFQNGQSTPFEQHPYYDAAEFFDANNDGIEDLVLGSNNKDTLLHVRLGSADGKYLNGIDSYNLSETPFSSAGYASLMTIIPTDLNNDGCKDVLATTINHSTTNISEEYYTRGDIAALINDCKGGFHPDKSYFLGDTEMSSKQGAIRPDQKMFWTSKTYLTDVNDDGCSDLILSSIEYGKTTPLIWSGVCSANKHSFKASTVEPPVRTMMVGLNFRRGNAFLLSQQSSKLGEITMNLYKFKK